MAIAKTADTDSSATSDDHYDTPWEFKNRAIAAALANCAATGNSCSIKSSGKSAALVKSPTQQKEQQLPLWKIGNHHHPLRKKDKPPVLNTEKEAPQKIPTKSVPEFYSYSRQHLPTTAASSDLHSSFFGSQQFKLRKRLSLNAVTKISNSLIGHGKSVNTRDKNHQMESSQFIIATKKGTIPASPSLSQNLNEIQEECKEKLDIKKDSRDHKRVQEKNNRNGVRLKFESDCSKIPSSSSASEESEDKSLKLKEISRNNKNNRNQSTKLVENLDKNCIDLPALLLSPTSDHHHKNFPTCTNEIVLKMDASAAQPQIKCSFDSGGASSSLSAKISSPTFHHSFEQGQKLFSKISEPPPPYSINSNTDSSPEATVPPKYQRQKPVHLHSSPVHKNENLNPNPPSSSSSRRRHNNSIDLEGLIHECLERGEAESLLKSRNIGTFLLRRRPVDGNLALSLRSSEGVLHIKLELRNGVWVLGEGPRFSTISSMIRAYRRTELPVRGAEHIKLGNEFRISDVPMKGADDKRK